MSLWNLYGPGFLVVPDGFTMPLTQRLKISGTDEALLVGAGRLSIASVDRPSRGAANLGTITISSDTNQLQYKRASLSGTSRVTLDGSSELLLFDLAPVGRLVLSGRGG